MQCGGNLFCHLVDLLPVLVATYTQNLMIICQGEVCKSDKIPSLSIKSLKDMTREKLGNGTFFSNLKYLQLI